MRTARREGMIMLQTLVMAIILSMIAVMVMKWVMARYLLASRDYRAAASVTHAHSIMGYTMLAWSPTGAYPTLSSIPSTGYIYPDGVTVQYSRTGIDPYGSFPVSITTNEDQ